MHQDNAVNVAILPWDSGYLLTYRDMNSFIQKFVWIDDVGTVQRVDSTDLTTVEYAYAENSQVRLVTMDVESWSMRQSFTLHTFDPDQGIVGRDTLLVLQLQQGDNYGGHCYEERGGVLRVAVAIAHSNGNQLEYSVRIARHADGQTSVSAPWNPGAIPAGAYLFGWSLATGPWDTAVLGYWAVEIDNARGLRFHSILPDGMPGGRHDLQLPDGLIMSGLDAAVIDGTVYPFFSAQSQAGLGGVFLAAFPLETILDATPPVPPLAQSFALSAYPNPFNSSVRLSYSTSGSQPAAIHLYDLQGRLVEVLEDLGATQGTVLWQPESIPSGVYFAVLRSGRTRAATKLLYIR